MTAATVAQLTGAWIAKNPLRRYRLTNQPKVTIAQSAAALGVSLVTIQKWEMGTATPGDDNMDNLEKFIGKGVRRDWKTWQEQRPQL